MKVLMLNGSPRKDGNTSIALKEMEQTFAKEGIETETVQVGNKNIRGCIACNFCKDNGRCVFDDAVNQLAPKFEEADGLVIASPVYYASANATLIACLDRLFHPVYDSLSPSRDHIPYFISLLMAVIVHMLAGL